VGELGYLKVFEAASTSGVAASKPMERRIVAYDGMVKTFGYLFLFGVTMMRWFDQRMKDEDEERCTHNLYWLPRTRIKPRQ
jgi:hypothetical protein